MRPEGYTQGAYARAMGDDGSRGRGGFDRRIVSYLISTPNVPVTGVFFRHAKRVLDLSEEQLMELLMANVQSPNEDIGAWRTLRS